eukprot:615908-Rhodomonas_salina.2
MERETRSMEKEMTKVRIEMTNCPANRINDARQCASSIAHADSASFSTHTPCTRQRPPASGCPFQVASDAVRIWIVEMGLSVVFDLGVGVRVGR